MNGPPHPPFRLAGLSIAQATAVDGLQGKRHDASCCGPVVRQGTDPAPVRTRLGDLDPHLHCSIIGTCLGVAELRKLMARFIDVQGASDLEVHHEAVRHASLGDVAAKALHKAFDQRHEAVIKRCARVRGPSALAELWSEALASGEVPGAYWAILSHRDVTPDLRQRVFGDVHMLSHLVGAANRADIRRLVALERDNAELRDRLDRQQARVQETIDAHQQRVSQLEQKLVESLRKASLATAALEEQPWPSILREEIRSISALVAVQAERRERAEQAAAASAAESTRVQAELEHLSQYTQVLAGELSAAETQLRERGQGDDGADPGGASLRQALRGRRILYVGGRPSSTPAIRDLVLRHGGEFQRHDGGLEDRKGLLAAAIGGADLVAFPVDCIDHDSAGNLKRLCNRSGIPFMPLRSASVASFAAGLSGSNTKPPPPAVCLRHG